MESVEGVFDLGEVIFIQHVPTDKIIKVQERAECLDDLLRNEALNCGHPDLQYERLSVVRDMEKPSPSPSLGLSSHFLSIG